MFDVLYIITANIKFISNFCRFFEIELLNTYKPTYFLKKISRFFKPRLNIFYYNFHLIINYLKSEKSIRDSGSEYLST